MTRSFLADLLDIPTTRLKYALERNESGSWGEEPTDADTVVVLRSTEQTIDGRWAIREPAIRALSPAERESTRLQVGDLLLTKSSGSPRHIGKTTMVDARVAAMNPGFGNFMQRLRVREDFEPRFVWYLLNHSLVRSQFDELSTTSTGLSNLNASIIGAVEIPAPPRAVQRAIADYLDRETARIDTLIDEQQRLIELLHERRRAVISNALHRGAANRTALRRLVDVIDCAHVTAAFVDDDTRFPVASIRECAGAYVDLSSCNYTTAEFFALLRASGRSPRAGDLLFVRNVSVGLVSEVRPGTPDFAVGQETVLLRRMTDADPTFLCYALTSSEVLQAIEGAMIGSTFRRINVSAIRALPVPLTPPDEQRWIAAYLDKETAKIDTLIAETERFIELSRERRAALITAAVTGQIDVRAVA